MHDGAAGLAPLALGGYLDGVAQKAVGCFPARMQQEIQLRIAQDAGPSVVEYLTVGMQKQHGGCESGQVAIGA